MINLTSIPPIPEEPDMDSNSFLRLMNLVSLVGDPDRVKKHVGEIMQARMAWVQAKSDAEEVLQVKSEIEKERAAVKAEREAFDKQLASERKAFEDSCNVCETKAANDEAVRVLADLHDRLERIKAAAALPKS
jgi:hypothetical protein